MTLRAENARGVAERMLTIVVGEEIALTPPMGWNSWNVWGGNVSQEKVLAAARLLVSSGLRDHGWTYVNIDDGWQGIRGGPFNAIQPNAKFPEMAQLSAEIHSLGLKFGLYSTPWRTSFYGQIGSSADSAEGKYEWIEDGTHTEFFKYRFPQDNSALAKFSWLKPLADWLHERRIQKITRRLRVFGPFSFARARCEAMERVGRRLSEIRLGAHRCRAHRGHAARTRRDGARRGLQRGQQHPLPARAGNFSPNE